jgi:hypothetical protein
MKSLIDICKKMYPPYMELVGPVYEPEVGDKFYCTDKKSYYLVVEVRENGNLCTSFYDAGTTTWDRSTTFRQGSFSMCYYGGKK